AQRGRHPGLFAPKPQRAPALNRARLMGRAAVGGEYQILPAVPSSLERFPVVVTNEVHVVPVVHASAAKRMGVQMKAQPANEVQSGTRRGTQTRDIPGIRRDLWLDEDDVQHDRALRNDRNS